MAEKDEKRKGKEGKEKESQKVALKLVAGDVKNRKISLIAFCALGNQESADRNIHFYVGRDYQKVAESKSGADGRTEVSISIPPEAKGSFVVSAKADGMALPESITVDIPEAEQKQTIVPVKRLNMESTWQGYDEYGNSKYQWIPRLFDENNKSFGRKITISTENTITIDGRSGTEFIVDVPKDGVKILKLVISALGLVEVDVFVHGCDIMREFQLRGKKVERTAGDPPAANANWWEKFKYGLKGGKL